MRKLLTKLNLVLKNRCSNTIVTVQVQEVEGCLPQKITLKRVSDSLSVDTLNGELLILTPKHN